VSALLNIAALWRRTGIAPDTLRKWELRYGVLRPTRTAGGQRRYSEQDVARVEWLRDRLAEGWRIGEAARVLQGSDAPALDQPDELRAALIEASQNGADVAALLDQAFAVLPLEQAFSEVIVPALRWVGDAWHAGHVSVAQEHAVTAKVRARFDQLLADARGAVRGVAVLAGAPGEQHDLGLLMLAVLLRGDGWHVEYLGANTPVEDAVQFAQHVNATIVCFSAARAESLTQLRTGLAALDRKAPPTLVVGGAAVSAQVAREHGATFWDDDVSTAVTRLRELAPA